MMTGSFPPDEVCIVSCIISTSATLVLSAEVIAWQSGRQDFYYLFFFSFYKDYIDAFKKMKKY